MKESEINWFRPLWRRVLVTAVCAVWLGFELIVSHEQLWMIISGAGLAYCLWNFFLKFPKDGAAPTEPPKAP
jgi:hypothetical protein